MVYLAKEETVGSDSYVQANVLGAVESSTVPGSLLMPEVTVPVVTLAARHDMGSSCCRELLSVFSLPLSLPHLIHTMVCAKIKTLSYHTLSPFDYYH